MVNTLARPNVEGSRPVPHPSAESYNLVRRTVPAFMRTARDVVRLHFAPAPPAASWRRCATAVEDPFIRHTRGGSKQIRSVGVRTEAHQVTGSAPRTLRAMSQAIRHKRRAAKEVS